MLKIEDIISGVQEIAPKYSLKKASLFGSYAEQRQHDSSDVDLLVEFDTDAVSLIVLSSLKYDLESCLGVPVDVLHAPLPPDSMITPEKVVPVYG